MTGCLLIPKCIYWTHSLIFLKKNSFGKVTKTEIKGPSDQNSQSGKKWTNFGPKRPKRQRWMSDDKMIVKRLKLNNHGPWLPVMRIFCKN